MKCPFEEVCSKAICSEYKHLTTRDSGIPRCDAFIEKRHESTKDTIETVLRELDNI